MKLVNLIPLKEIDFRNQDAFDAYTKQHDLRPDTKVKIAGKTTTAGQAASKSKEPAIKGNDVFGKDGGSKVFGSKKRYDVTFGDAGSGAAKAIYDKEFQKQKQSGRDFSKDPFPQFGSDAWRTMHSDMRRKAAEKNPGYQKIKGTADKFKSMGYEESEAGYGDYGSALMGKQFTKTNDDGSVTDIYMMPTKDGNIEVKSTKGEKSEKKRGGLMGLLGKKDKTTDYKDTDKEVIDINGKSDDEIVNDITKHVGKLDKK